MAPAKIVFGANAAFIAGIFVSSAGWNPYAFLVLSGVGIWFIVRRRTKLKHLAVFIIFVGAVAGLLYYRFFLNFRDEGRNIPYGEKRDFHAMIVEEPRVVKDFVRLTVSLEPPQSGDIAVLAGPGDYRYGDTLRLSGTVEPSPEPQLPVVFFPDIETTKRNGGAALKRGLLDLKNALVGSLTRTLPFDAAALMSGLTLGETGDFNADLKRAMAASGTTHLVALSGYNILVIARSMSRSFGRFFSRRKTFYLTVAAIAAFVIMTGAEASVVRAAIMGFLLLLAGEAGRMYDIPAAVAFTATVMLVHDPTLLLWNAGFQLSFLSFFGILYLEPALRRLTRYNEEHPGFLGIKEHALTSIAAQLAVAPLLMTMFGRISLLAPLANMLILPFVPFTMALGFLIAATGLIPFLGLAAKAMAMVAYVPLSGMLAVIRFFALLPAAFPDPGTTWTLAAAYYAALFFLIAGFPTRTSSKP